MSGTGFGTDLVLLKDAGTNVLGRTRRVRAVPEGRQAEWNGALLRSKIKQGPTCSTYKKEDRRLAIFLFACGAYESNFPQAIGRKSALQVCHSGFFGKINSVKFL